MTVYLLIEHWEYEGDTVVDVYATNEAASEAATRLNKDEFYGRRCSFLVRSFEVKGKVEGDIV